MRATLKLSQIQISKMDFDKELHEVINYMQNRICCYYLIGKLCLMLLQPRLQSMGFPR